LDFWYENIPSGNPALQCDRFTCWSDSDRAVNVPCFFKLPKNRHFSSKIHPSQIRIDQKFPREMRNISPLPTSTAEGLMYFKSESTSDFFMADVFPHILIILSWSWFYVRHKLHRFLNVLPTYMYIKVALLYEVCT
jgi:hypothetical protein